MWSIKSRKKWVATKDLRTRHDHGMADNQVVDYDQPFDVGGYKMMFPGDGSLGAPGHELYNCRCTVVNATDDDLEAEDHMMRVKDPETGRYELVKKKSYREWYDEKKAQHTPEQWAALARAGKNYQADKREYADFINILGGKAPKTFAKFQDLKYNDQEAWNKLYETKHQTQTVKAAPCVTTPKKYTEYFLKPGAKHADQFFDVGYSADDPLRLRYDMARQFDMGKAVDVRDLGGGAKRFNIYMTLGVTKKRLFVTGWIQGTPNSKPRIVTSFRKNEANKHD